MATLLEKYSRPIKVAEAYVANNFDGKKISETTKLNTAVLIDNTNKFMTMMESFGPNTQATERSNLGEWKKFCLNLTNIAVPSLIANDLVIVHAMTSFSGSVAYLEYQSRTTKGGVSRGDTLNSVFGLGEMNEDRMNFTRETIIDTFTESALAFSATPIEGGLRVDDPETFDPKFYTYKVINKDGVRYVAGKADYTPVAGDKVVYKSEEFQMTHVPAQDIPTIGPVMKRIPLVAEPRRIAVKYDQITAFQAKTDYGFDLADGLAEQAVGQLSYEIDTEVCNMLIDAASPVASIADFSKTLPVGVNLADHYAADHYAAFAAKLEEYKMALYDRTKKFVPNFMLVASDVMPVIQFVPGFQAASVSDINGPYFAGTLAGLKVFVTPNIDAGKMVFGVNQGAMQAAAGIYAPYMPVVPTQLLGFADGAMSQGWSTMYDCKILNADLLISANIVA